MRVHYIFFVLVLLFSCQPDSPTTTQKTATEKTPPPSKVEKTLSPWEQFWGTFQKAVRERDVKTIAANTVFPLPGSEALNEGKTISEATFEEHFSKLFDAKTVETFNASTGNMSDFTTKSEMVAEQLNVPVNVKVRAITVLYVFDEGTEIQTESSMTYHFAETEPNIFKLVSVIAAG